MVFTNLLKKSHLHYRVLLTIKYQGVGWSEIASAGH